MTRLSVFETYPEQYWEIFDPTNAEVVAHVFDESMAKTIMEYLNRRRFPPPLPDTKKRRPWKWFK